MRDLRSKEQRGPQDPDKENGKTGGEEQQPLGGSLRGERHAPPRTDAVHLFEHPDEHSPTADGGVWEDEITEESLKKLRSKIPHQMVVEMQEP